MRITTIIIMLVGLTVAAGCSSVDTTEETLTGSDDAPLAMEIAFWPSDGWQPSGNLAKIPLHADCDETDGGLSVIQQTLSFPWARICYCPDVAIEMETEIRGSTHYFFVSEVGHYATQGGTMRAVDRWVVEQLLDAPNGRHYVDQALTWMDDHRDLECEDYGTLERRASFIRQVMSTDVDAVN